AVLVTYIHSWCTFRPPQLRQTTRNVTSRLPGCPDVRVITRLCRNCHWPLTPHSNVGFCVLGMSAVDAVLPSRTTSMSNSVGSSTTHTVRETNTFTMYVT